MLPIVLILQGLLVLTITSSRYFLVHSYSIPIHHHHHHSNYHLNRQRPFVSLQSSSGSGSDYNVVLRPSFDVNDAFDNFKVGNCRVHRYAPVMSSSSDDSSSSSSNSNSDGSLTEYVMWYHGRDQVLEKNSPQSSDSDSDASSNNAPLPPLSTGRIGRATSRNGLVWEKDRVGSQSEDRTGVALGLNLESWWSFDTSHVGLGCVLLPLSTPAVLSADGVYLMYYMGGNYEEISILEYLNESDALKLPPSVLDSKLRGMNMKIGVALSQDGISWGRVEGDDPTGACMVPYSKTDPNQASQQPNSNNEKYNIPEELYCAWPEVIVNESPNTPTEAFVMYYSTMMKETKQKVIAYAVSEDGFRWYKRGPCIVPTTTSTSTTPSPDGNGCSRCCVYQDATYQRDAMQWVTNTPATWTMYYEGTSTVDQHHRICMAKSTNGIHWEKQDNPLVLDIGAPNTWDCNGVGSPHCIRYGCCFCSCRCCDASFIFWMVDCNSCFGLGCLRFLYFFCRLDDGTIRMYYTGQGVDGSTAIGVAQLRSYDSNAVWVREQASITFATVAD